MAFVVDVEEVMKGGGSSDSGMPTQGGHYDDRLLNMAIMGKTDDMLEAAK